MFCQGLMICINLLISALLTHHRNYGCKQLKKNNCLVLFVRFNCYRYRLCKISVSNLINKNAMKKLLLSFALLACVIMGAQAQQNGKSPNPNYQYSSVTVRQNPDRYSFGNLRFHLMGSIGDGDLFNMFTHRRPDMFMAGCMLEYQANRFIGLGLGAEFYGSASRWNRPRPDMDYYLMSLPLYANVRLALPLGLVRPFVEGRIGYSFPLNTAYSNTYGSELQSQGLYTGFGIGVTVGHSSFSSGINVTDVYKAHEAQSFQNAPWDSFVDYYVRYAYAFGSR